jgi:chromosome segregation ATPase
MPRKPNKKVTLALVYAKLVQHDRRFAEMTDQITGQFAEVARQIFRLEDSLRAEIAVVVERVRQVERILDKQTADIDALRQEYFALLQATRRIEETLNVMKERNEQIDRELLEIFTRLERVEARLSAIELQTSTR